MYKSEFNDKFNWFSSMFAALLSISVAVYAVYLYGSDAMTQPLPPLVLGLIILAVIFALLALYNGIRGMFAAKDTRLDDLIKVVKEIKTKQPESTDNFMDIATGLVMIVKAIKNMSGTKKGA